MRLSLHIDGVDRKDTIEKLKTMLKCLQSLADNGHVSWRTPDGMSATIAPEGAFPGQVPDYEVLGCTEDDVYVIVRFHRMSPEEILGSIGEILDGPGFMDGYWVERDGTRHRTLKTWMHLPVKRG